MDLLGIVITLTVLVFSAILHEIAHGYVADRFGDPTARLMGRLTLNPKSHIDPFMSILLPLFLMFGGSPVIFGAAKPVPVDPFNLKEGRKDMSLVALAGPLTNILIAVAATLLLHGLSYIFTSTTFYLEANEPSLFAGIVNFVLIKIVELNLLLAVFNLLPIPPLDGSKIFALLLPEKHANVYMSLGNYGIFIILFLMMFPIGGFSLGSFIFNLLEFSKGFLGL